MIDRYSITATPDAIRARFAVDVPAHVHPKFNAAPTQLLPVITSNAPQGVSTFYWGTSPEWAKNKTVSEKIINVRSELISEKSTLQKMLMTNRCIIPADGFYAWKKAGKKTMIPYRFVLTSKDLFAIAGFWDEYEDTDGNEFHTFSMITTAAAGPVKSIYDRMPVLLSIEGEKQWLDKGSKQADLLALLVPYAAGDLSLYSVSPRISDTSVDVPSLVIPTPPADQFGNLTLFD